MCNLYRMEAAPDAVAALARELGREVRFPEGAPNVEPRDVRITDRAPILRSAGTPTAADLVVRRWSWPNSHGKPLFNLRSEGRRFPLEGRCVALADGFYEFSSSADLKAKRKDRWLITWPGHEWFGIAAIWRNHQEAGEAFTLLTCEPGPDMVPYHHRQIVLLSPAECFAWLDPANDAGSFLQPSPEGTLKVERA